MSGEPGSVITVEDLQKEPPVSAEVAERCHKAILFAVGAGSENGSVDLTLFDEDGAAQRRLTEPQVKALIRSLKLAAARCTGHGPYSEDDGQRGLPTMKEASVLEITPSGTTPGRFGLTSRHLDCGCVDESRICKDLPDLLRHVESFYTSGAVTCQEPSSAL